MPEFFLELLSEEIPARMQSEITDNIRFAIEVSLAKLGANNFQQFYGPRRQAFVCNVEAETQRNFVEIRGPKEAAPVSAIEGFARKYGVQADQLIMENGIWWFRQQVDPVPAAAHIKTSLDSVLKSGFWPKSMRWGQSGDFNWVRPLRGVVCLLDGEIVPITVGPITAGNKTEGHRVHAPGVFTVSSVAAWHEKLRGHFVIADQNERRRKISEGIAGKGALLQLTVALDDTLIDEVTGLVEWPVPLLGRIDKQFMDLPPEVRELSMKINQKYFALRDTTGAPAPYFAFVANLAAEDGGHAIVAGNERVLRARLADARHFWTQDIKKSLDQYIPKLDSITFHGKIGSQGDRATRISFLAVKIAEVLGANPDEVVQTRFAGALCKADLCTGLVSEFPELQGVIGGYYAEINPRGWSGKIVGAAIRTHYQPKGPSDEVPTGTVACAVALADKLDTLIEFFRIGERPTGSGDPYALRRAALGIIRIILENKLQIRLKPLVNSQDIFDFVIERLRVKLRSEGRRFDILDAVLASGNHDDLEQIMRRVRSMTLFLQQPDGANLLIAYRRAANILRIEDAKDGPHRGFRIYGEFETSQEQAFQDQLDIVERETIDDFEQGNFGVALASLAKLRSVVDEFFDAVKVNTDSRRIRRNRLGLLARFREIVDQIADFSKIEG